MTAVRDLLGIARDAVGLCARDLLEWMARPWVARRGH